MFGAPQNRSHGEEAQRGLPFREHAGQAAQSRFPTLHTALIFPAWKEAALSLVEKHFTLLSCSEWCLCQSAAVYGIMSYTPASLLSYPVISNVEN